MVVNLQTTTNTNDEATITGLITINDTTSTTILAAQTPGALPRIKVIVRNHDNRDVWIKFQAASIDNDQKGFVIIKQTSEVILEHPNIYTGEISAITDSGTTTLSVTDF